MTAGNGFTTAATNMGHKMGAISKLKKWRKHQHDRGKQKKKIKTWARELCKDTLNGKTKMLQPASNRFWKNDHDAILPSDPLHWEPQHVILWIQTVSEQYRFVVDCSLFSMNGKGLCLMSLYGFRFRSPDGGAVLHADLKRKLLKQMLLGENTKTNEFYYLC